MRPGRADFSRLGSGCSLAAWLPAAALLAAWLPTAALLALTLFACAARPAAAREKSPLCIIPPDERAHRSEQIREAIERYSAASAYPVPPLQGERLDKLMDGEVVRFREKWVLSREGDQENERTRQRALAYRLVPSPRARAWIAVLDPHFPLNDSLTEHRMTDDERGTSTWYQFMDLPWPIRNRHWVIRVTKGTAVTEATAGQAWEHSWSLVPDGEAAAREWAAAGRAAPLDLEKVEGARYLEANDGAWALIALDENVTLVVYNLTIVLGGWVPEGMASRFAMRALEDLLDRVAANAERVPTHYIEGHDPVYGGDAQPVPFFPAESP